MSSEWNGRTIRTIPVPSSVENPFAYLLKYPDERQTEERSDVLTFTTEPLKPEVDLAGSIEAKLDVDVKHEGGVIPRATHRRWRGRCRALHRQRTSADPATARMAQRASGSATLDIE